MARYQAILKKSSISLILEGYDEIFSDFDPRPYRERTISDDFLREAQKVVHEAPTGALEIEFLVPVKGRSKKNEQMIKERLHEHFRSKHQELITEKRSIIRRGMILAIVGFILMLAVSSIYTLSQTGFWENALRAIMEPGGWFMSWYGLDLIFYTAGQKNTELKFYTKMSRGVINFQTY